LKHILFFQMPFPGVDAKAFLIQLRDKSTQIYLGGQKHRSNRIRCSFFFHEHSQAHFFNPVTYYPGAATVAVYLCLETFIKKPLQRCFQSDKHRY